MNYTPRQLEVLNIIYEYVEKNGYAPTLKEMAEILKINSVTIFEHLQALERKRAITRRTYESRSTEIIDKDFLSAKTGPQATVLLRKVIDRIPNIPPELQQEISNYLKKHEKPGITLIPAPGSPI